jgi:hypothetical protein
MESMEMKLWRERVPAWRGLRTAAVSDVGGSAAPEDLIALLRTGSVNDMRTGLRNREVCADRAS